MPPRSNCIKTLFTHRAIQTEYTLLLNLYHNKIYKVKRHKIYKVKIYKIYKVKIYKIYKVKRKYDAMHYREQCTAVH